MIGLIRRYRAAGKREDYLVRAGLVMMGLLLLYSFLLGTGVL
jgi:hypothetical protein